MITDDIIRLLIVSVSSFAAVYSAYIARKTAVISKQNSELSFRAFDANRNEQKQNLHIQFQSTIRDLQLKLPNKVNDESYLPTESEKRIITIFWYCIFDEWYVCLLKCPEYYSDLWNDKYLITISLEKKRT